MILGPVFRAELMRTSRRRRYYVMRSLYGLGLFFLFYSNYEALIATLEMRERSSYQVPLISVLAGFAHRTFTRFAGVQLAMLLALVPALCGGVIADEKQRKTIHYLMASRLSSGEIVFDKLLARVLHVLVFVLLGAPILSLLSLMGGIPWQLIAGLYAGTFSLLFFTAALSTLVSTLARRVRQGVLIAYLLVIFWLIGPLIADHLFRFLYPKFHAWIAPFDAWLLASSPAQLYVQHVLIRGTPLRGGPTPLLEDFLWMVGLQAAAGVAFLLLAVHQLRPAFRRQETGTQRLTWFSAKRRRPRWMNRPGCGTDAMLWKECHFSRTDVFTKLVVLPATILLSVGLLLTSGVDEWLWASIKELFREGYWGHFTARNSFNLSLRRISPVYIALWLLAVAGASASSLTVEREEDTWTSLTSTPLSGWEILRGKMIGAVWGLRGFGALLGLFWLAGLLTGAIHPLGILLALLLVALFTWGVSALGVYASLTARSTSRALTATLATLVFVNWGYFWLARPLLTLLGYPPEGRILELGCTPYLTTFALVSFDDIRAIFGPSNLSVPPVNLDWAAVGFVSLVLFGHLSAALLLSSRGHRRFDAVVDRPSSRGDRATG